MFKEFRLEFLMPESLCLSFQSDRQFKLLFSHAGKSLHYCFLKQLFCICLTYQNRKQAPLVRKAQTHLSPVCPWLSVCKNKPICASILWQLCFWFPHTNLWSLWSEEVAELTTYQWTETGAVCTSKHFITFNAHCRSHWRSWFLFKCFPKSMILAWTMGSYCAFKPFKTTFSSLTSSSAFWVRGSLS